MRSGGQTKVAIVGSGMAGLVTAYLLSHDAQQRYEVTIFEKGEELSLDSASVSLRDEHSGSIERVDMPMRSIAGGYYRNTCAMYDALGIAYRAQRFLFAFSEHTPRRSLATPYFIHASNLHQLPPRPAGMGLLRHVATVLFVLMCYAWLSLCCFLLPPSPKETFGDYTRRIWLPPYFVSHYALPLMASVATCSHEEFMQFPASDMTEYKRRSHGQDHYVVTNGVCEVQDKLTEKIAPPRMSAQVVRVAPTGSGKVTLWWKSSQPGSEEKKAQLVEETFDRVVMALSPNVIGAIFEPLRSEAAKIPTIGVESLVLQRPPGAAPLAVVGGDDAFRRESTHSSSSQVMTLNSSFGGKAGSSTEALHLVDCGALVATVPFSVDEDAPVLHRTAFPRVLRTVESRRVVNRWIKGEKGSDGQSQWSNGSDNIWLAGGWCWDGMVLLEGCVVSAMRVADDFGVGVPWRDGGLKAL